MKKELGFVAAVLILFALVSLYTYGVRGYGAVGGEGIILAAIPLRIYCRMAHKK